MLHAIVAIAPELFRTSLLATARAARASPLVAPLVTIGHRCVSSTSSCRSRHSPLPSMGAHRSPCLYRRLCYCPAWGAGKVVVASEVESFKRGGAGGWWVTRAEGPPFARRPSPCAGHVQGGCTGAKGGIGQILTVRYMGISVTTGGASAPHRKEVLFGSHGRRRKAPKRSVSSSPASSTSDDLPDTIRHPSQVPP